MFDNNVMSFDRTVMTANTEGLDSAMHKVFCQVYENAQAEDEEILDLTTVLSTREKGRMFGALTDNGASDNAASALVNSTIQLATMANCLSGIFAPEEFGLAEGAFIQGDELMPGIAYTLEFGDDNDQWVAGEATATVINELGVFDDEMLAKIHAALGESGTGVRSISDCVPPETLELAQELLDLMRTNNSRNIYGVTSENNTPYMGVEMLAIIDKCLVRFCARLIFHPEDVEIITDIPADAVRHGLH